MPDHPDAARRRERRADARASRRFAELIALAAEKRDIRIKTALERDVRLVRFEDGQLEIALEPSARKTLVNDLARKLSEWTGRRWMVVVSAEQGAADRQVAERGAAQPSWSTACAPIRWCRPCWQRFPGAEIVGVRGATTQHAAAARRAAATMPPPDAADDDGDRDDGQVTRWLTSWA